MRKHKAITKCCKNSLIILALFLALGLFAAMGAQSSYAAVAQYSTTPVLGTPTVSSASSRGYDSVKIAWSAVSGASFYEVYYATSATGTYSKAGTSTTTSLTKTGLTCGKTYYFKVRAGAVSGTTKVYGKFSSYKSAKPIPSTPSVTAASASYTSVKVSWTAIPGASGYRVYRATSSTGTYTYLGATTSLAYTSASLTTGKTYYYKVIAYRTVGTTKVYSKSSAAAYAKPVPAKTTCSVATKTMTKANISWTGVSGATKYEVWRAASASGTYTLVSTVAYTTKSYVDVNLTTGKTYYYKVRAYHLEGTTKVYGSSSTPKSVVLGSVYTAGTYKVGTDIPAGEYLLVSTKTDYAYFYTATKLTTDPYYWNCEGYPSPTQYASLQTGEYATFEYVKIYPVATAPFIGVNADGSFVPGQYKVGRDIPAGTYVINLQGTTEYGDLYIEMNSYNQPESIVGWDSYRGRIYVTLAAGQYFTFDYGVAYPVATAPALDMTQTYLHDGMYLVGTDIPAGTYTITTKDPDWGYYGVYSDATHSEESIIDFDTLDTNKQVTVSTGQYLFVFEGYFLTPTR
jgi:hypothetical protein